ncbi:MAG: hypothetical protein ACO1SV_07735 [Fimbriimonas sp.]
MIWALLGVALETRLDLSAYDPSAGVRVGRQGDELVAAWPMEGGKWGRVAFSLDPRRPLVRSVGGERPILRDVDPAGVVTVGTRDLKPAGWTIFFDNPRQRPYEAFPLVLRRDSIRVVTEDGRTSVVLEGASAGPFQGEYRFTFYPGGRLVRAGAVMATSRDATAYLYDAGLVASSERRAPWGSLAYVNLADRLVRPSDASALTPQVRMRTILAEGPEGGSLAILPEPHRFFYPLDEVHNLNSVWHGRDYRALGGTNGFGIRQTVEGDRRWVPWVNAPVGTRQDMGFFMLVGEGDASRTLKEVARYTRNDRFAPLPGHRTFSSHYHVEHAVDFLNRQRRQGTNAQPLGVEDPAFVRRFKRMGVNAVHLGEFHLGDNELRVADRLTRLRVLHEECARLSTSEFLLLPGEEPNVHLGGHWLSFFPKPVYWTLDRPKGAPFVEERPGFGKVYHVGSSEDVLKLMEAEDGLMWTAHPRIKASQDFPDKYREQPFFRSDRFLGGAWKAMPADYSLPRLGSRVLDLLDDMNQWGARKQTPGEVDVFAIDDTSELYAHMNVNYLRLDRLPRFDQGWSSILGALRGGRFFTTTGEVLIPSCTIGGAASGETAQAGPTFLTAELRWTFPLRFAEIVSGDGNRIERKRIDLSDTRAFGSRKLRVPVDLTGKKWARFEVWDVAANGAFTQPVWLRMP